VILGFGAGTMGRTIHVNLSMEDRVATQSNEHALPNNNSRVRLTAYMIDALNGRNIGDFTGMQDFAAARL
jgi:hypothetical protein